MMIEELRSKWKRAMLIQLIIVVPVLLFVLGCGQTEKLSEFEGLVVGKREPADHHGVIRAV